jgi:hypothetical protein
MPQVEITLNGRTETLVCTLRAARIVNAGGGFIEVLRKLTAYDMDAYVGVVAAGLNKKPADVEDAVFASGLPDLNEPLSNFVSMLANGGRPLKSETDAGAGEA